MTESMSAPYVTGLVTIETSYRGPTDHQGARIIARVGGQGGPRITVPYDHALDGPDNHAAAAGALQARMVANHYWTFPYRLIGGATRDGMAFVLYHSDREGARS